MVPCKQPPGRCAHELGGGVGVGVAVRVLVVVGIVEGSGDAEAEVEEEADFEGSEEREGMGFAVPAAVADAPGERVSRGDGERAGEVETERLWPAEKDRSGLRDAADAEGLVDAATLPVRAGVALGKLADAEAVDKWEGGAEAEGEPLATGGREAAACGDTVWDPELSPDAASPPVAEALIELEAQRDGVRVAPADLDAEAQRVCVSMALRAVDAVGRAEAVKRVEGDDAHEAVTETLPDDTMVPLALDEGRGEALPEALKQADELCDGPLL
jgi:hypothetical protein